MKMTITEMQAIETEILHEVVRICKRNNINYFLHCGSALGAIRHQGPIPWDPDVDIIVPNDEINNFCAAIRRELPEKYYLDYYDTNKSYPCLFPRIGLRGYSTYILHIDIFRLVGISSDKSKQIKFTKIVKYLSWLHFYKIQSEKYHGKFKLKEGIILRIIKLCLLPISTKFIEKIFENYCKQYSFDATEYVTNPNGHYGLKNILKKSLYGKGTEVKYAGFNVRIPEYYDAYLRHYYGDYMQLPPIEKRNMNQIYLIGEL